MKKLSLLVAVVMALSLCGAMAEGTGANSPAGFDQTTDAAVAEQMILEQPLEYSIIPADETTGQKELTYLAAVTPIIEADGLKFKDMNKNGALDIYEDYRQETDTRVADLIAQMNTKELANIVFCVSADLATARELIADFGTTCMLFNLNGTPATTTNTLNNLQAAAEKERLGVPMTFTSDREYNAFGGYIDKAHEGFGTANDPELAYQLACIYAKAMHAIGIHVTFEPYAEEIGAQYGENPEYISSIVHEEIRGLEENGLASCTKHWIGRGGDSNFGGARSVAQNFDNWMVGWKNALSAGSEWVMTNCGGTGITNTCDVKWDPVTMGYLRNEIGFDGVVVTDWWPLGFTGHVQGINPDGIDIGKQSIYWMYDKALEYGTDVFGTSTMAHDYSNWENQGFTNYPDAIIDGLNSGEVHKENVEKAATRVLRFKFNHDLFDNPYRDPQAALDLCSSTEYAANPTPITTNEELRAARNPAEVELTERLQAESAVLIKNDNNLLPLSKDTKIYIESSSSDAEAGYKKYIAQAGGIVVDEMEDADVIVGDFAKVTDATELFIDDAHDAGKPIVYTSNNTKPTQYMIENADAVMYLSYNHRADHGTTIAGMVTSTEPWVYVDLLYGVRQPGGVLNKEIARDAFNDDAQWKDLAGDQGASPYVRLMIQATMEDDKEYHASPRNWGDPLLPFYYGMSYGVDPDFNYSCLILPISQTATEEEGSSGKTTRIDTVQSAKAGEPFTVYCLLRNNGGTGLTTVQAKANDTVVAEKIMAVEGGSWRVVQMDLTLEAGEYIIDVGGQTGTLTVA